MNQTLEKLLDKAHEFLNTKTVVGDPIHIDDLTLIPISKISVGFGSGDHNAQCQHNDKSVSEGFGGGMNICPVAVIAVYKEHAKLMMLTGKEQQLGKILDLVPDLLDRFAPKKTDHKEDE
ncbi:TPA: hypothetical protein DCG86_01125 [Candidatus Marinimicrobia bacterium]|nr:MAG: Uncharacterized protein XD77_0401 [Marinimicrobia bacterium 46_47]KUK93504.1 MAG: Uncharacterized protein XE04_0203 [Marinimicrobia bacterium 46_43]HAE86605.1 hypothetical protein [Candidatus Neomarinimicrobiota bacterium]HBY17739.1 hypothetical protein [Candidatus Neomarinimicrobiota bacterium]